MKYGDSRFFQHHGPLPEEVVVVADERRELWLDVRALLSNYECMYGDGCRGVEPPGGEGKRGVRSFEDRAVAGCCRTAPYYNSTLEDTPERIRPAVHALTAEDCENVELVREGYYQDYVERNRKGEPRTLQKGVLHRGHCIFLNSDEHDKPGCALWHHAVRTGQRPQDVRPQVCHTEPLVMWWNGLNGDGIPQYVITLRPYWLAFFEKDSWYCTKDPAAFRAETPVFQRMEEQVRWTIGGGELADRAIERLTVAWEESGKRIMEGWGQPVFLPEPQPLQAADGPDAEPYRPGTLKGRLLPLEPLTAWDVDREDWERSRATADDDLRRDVADASSGA